MTAPKVFATGVTGYIGGDGLFALVESHPDWNITALVRNSAKGAKVASQYPRVKLVYGDLSSSDLIEEEARRADVVLHFANADDEPSAKAIAAGIASRSTPGYWIHTSGTGILTYPDLNANTFGDARPLIWDDIADISKINSIPDEAPHRNVDKIVFAAASAHPNTIKTAIVCPPTIYSRARGPDNQDSAQVPELANAFLRRGKGFQIGAGKNLWTNVHIHDLSALYLKLAEDAVSGGHKASWGTDGYYFAEHTEFVWGEVAQKLAITAHESGLLDSADIDSISNEEARKILVDAPVQWGSNSRCRASRARKDLGWKPVARSLDDDLSDTLEREVQKLGMRKGHAAKAAGDA